MADERNLISKQAEWDSKTCIEMFREIEMMNRPYIEIYM